MVESKGAAPRPTKSVAELTSEIAAEQARAMMQIGSDLLAARAAGDWDAVRDVAVSLARAGWELMPRRNLSDLAERGSASSLMNARVRCVSTSSAYRDAIGIVVAVVGEGSRALFRVKFDKRAAGTEIGELPGVALEMMP